MKPNPPIDHWRVQFFIDIHYLFLYCFIMSPIEVLKKHYVGKRITHVNIHLDMNKFIGGEITSIRLDFYDPIFIFTVKLVDGTIENVDVSEYWDIEVN